MSAHNVVSIVEYQETNAHVKQDYIHWLNLFLECKYPSDVNGLGLHVHEPLFAGLLRAFLNDQLGGSDSESDMDVSDEGGDILEHISPISVFHSAISSFYTPSDPSGLHGMHHECIRSTPSWQSSGLQHDCVFVVEDEDKKGFQGMSVISVKLFFSLERLKLNYIIELD